MGPAVVVVGVLLLAAAAWIHARNSGATAGSVSPPILHGQIGGLPPASCVVGAPGFVVDESADPPQARGTIMSCSGACVTVRDDTTGDLVCGDLK